MIETAFTLIFLLLSALMGFCVLYPVYYQVFRFFTGERPDIINDVASYTAISVIIAVLVVLA